MITTEIINKIHELRDNNHTPLRMEFNKKTYLEILEECGCIKREGIDYFWDKPGLVVKDTNKPNYPNYFYGIPFTLNEDGFDWVITSEEKSNE